MGYLFPASGIISPRLGDIFTLGVITGVIFGRLKVIYSAIFNLWRLFYLIPVLL